jgi:hypothetical protein
MRNCSGLRTQSRSVSRADDAVSDSTDEGCIERWWNGTRPKLRSASGAAQVAAVGHSSQMASADSNSAAARLPRLLHSMPAVWSSCDPINSQLELIPGVVTASHFHVSNGSLAALLQTPIGRMSFSSPSLPLPRLPPPASPVMASVTLYGFVNLSIGIGRSATCWFFVRFADSGCALRLSQ